MFLDSLQTLLKKIDLHGLPADQSPRGRRGHGRAVRGLGVRQNQVPLIRRYVNLCPLPDGRVGSFPSLVKGRTRPNRSRRRGIHSMKG